MKILNSSSTGSIISSDYNWKELSLELIKYKDKFSLDNSKFESNICLFSSSSNWYKIKNYLENL